MSGKAVLRFLLVVVVLLLGACASRPDLGRLYETSNNNPDQPPVIIIHGLAGSTLVDAKTGKQFWPGSLSTLTFSNYRDLARMSAEDREGEGLVPGDLFYSVAGVDFYAELLARWKRSGTSAAACPACRSRPVIAGATTCCCTTGARTTCWRCASCTS